MEEPSDRKRARPASQREALETIYHRLGGTEWTRQENWLSTDADLSQWSGVTCSASGHITALELSQNNLKGEISDVIEALLPLAPTLEQLWLSENGLSGNLPSALADQAQFPALTILDVGSNQLRGSLHPAFARATHFSWCDLTGNELTSYFRYTNNNTNRETNIAVNDGSKKSSSPLSNVHVVPALLTEPACQELVDLAVDYTNRNGGWQMDRHKDYRTTDIDVAMVGGDLLSQCNNHLKDAILPTLAQLFHFPVQDLAMEDLFLAKYSATRGQQRSLAQHRDGSELSFVITLNDAFQGGGTTFLPGNVTVAPKTAGTGVFFCGRLLHAGVEVVDGTRYILAGFVRVYPSTPDGVIRLQELIRK